jgi:ribonuclease P protein component
MLDQTAPDQTVFDKNCVDKNSAEPEPSATHAAATPAGAAALPRWKYARLTTPADYDRVFARSERARIDAYLVMASPNELGFARLGLIVAKRLLKHAVDRNRAKRCARAAFQSVRDSLPACDFVVRVIAKPEPGKESVGLARALQRAGHRAQEKWPVSPLTE